MVFNSIAFLIFLTIVFLLYMCLSLCLFLLSVLVLYGIRKCRVPRMITIFGKINGN